MLDRVQLNTNIRISKALCIASWGIVLLLAIHGIFVEFLAAIGCIFLGMWLAFFAVRDGLKRSEKE